MAKKTGADKQASATIGAAAIGAAAVIVATLVSGLFTWLKGNAPPAANNTEQHESQHVESGGQGVNLQNSSDNTIILSQESPTPGGELLTRPPPPPPENFPPRESFSLPLLTDNDRESPFYLKTIVEIHNKTEMPIRVAYSIVPLDNSLSGSRTSRYAHIVTEEILPGEIIEDERQKFGGPVHLSVFSNNKWSASNEWVDLKIKARREIEITKHNASFSFGVFFGGSE